MKSGGKTLAQTHSMVEIEGGQLASVLKANYQALIRGDMVKKGNTQEQAEAGIDMLIALARFVRHVELSIGTNEALTQARLKIDLNL